MGTSVPCQDSHATKGLVVYSIFLSVSGEIGPFPQGAPVAFLRLAGCDLKCGYCDTKEAQAPQSGSFRTFEYIMKGLSKLKTSQLIITGGEPLLQYRDLEYLCAKLKSKGYTIAIETNGQHSVHEAPVAGSGTSVPLHRSVDQFIFDFKLPGSGMMGKVDPLISIPPRSLIKFVCCDYNDYHYALKIRELLKTAWAAYNAPHRNEFKFLFSAATSKVHPSVLAGWMLMSVQESAGVPGHYFSDDCLLNLQVHKFIWPDSEQER